MITALNSTGSGQARPVRVGIVGYGYWGKNLARNLSVAESTDLVAVVDPAEGAQRAAQRNLPGVRVLSTLDELLAGSDVEAVVLATAAAQHAEMATQVLESGRHVLVEKPLATTPEDAEQLVKLADASGLTLMVGHTFLYSAPVLRLRQYLEQGELGDVQYMYSQRLSLGRIRRDCNALWNFGPHDVSIMLYLIGERPTEVSARGLSFITDGIDDVCFGTMTFGSGIGGNLHVSWIDPRKQRLLTVVGNRKMAVYDDVSVDKKIQIVDAGVAESKDKGFGEYESLGDFQWRTRVGDIVIPNIPMSEPLLAEVEAFGQSCRTGEKPATDGRHGADVVRILAALDQSARERGAPVELEW